MTRDQELARFCDLLTIRVVEECRRPVVLKSEPQRLTRGEIAACELTVSAQLANGKRGTYGEHHGAHESNESPDEERERAGVDRMGPWQP